jgi:parallel beta-helix repeat protein
LLTLSFTNHPSSIPTSVVPQPEKSYSQSSILHDPISITNDDDFKKLGFEGNGTEVDPYLIKDLIIEADDDGKCISIESTSAFFIIQNCELFSDDDKSGTGIYLEKVENGAIVECNITTLDVGISVLKSESCEFKSNTLSRLGKGFYLTQSRFMNIEGNRVTESDYGIHLYKMGPSELITNTVEDCDYGVLIGNGFDIQTRSNQISGSFFALYFHNTIRCESISNLISTSLYGVYSAYSQECNVSLSELTRNKYGVAFLEVDGGTISSNFVKSNKEYGIHIKNSLDVDILSNIIFDNKGTGLYLNGVSGASIHNNEIGFNSGANAVDSIGTGARGLVNNWDTNAWSDYSGTPTYSIPGDRGSLDNDPHYILYLESLPDITIAAPASGNINWSASAFSPDYFSTTVDGAVVDEGAWDGHDLSAVFTALDPGAYTFTVSINTTSGISNTDVVIVSVIDSTSPEWISVPEDQVIECGVPFSYQLYASDHYGITKWWVNSTEFSIDHGLLQNISSLYYGVYHLEVQAFDPSDNYVSAILSLTVTDNVLPSVDSPDDVVFPEGENGHAIIWNVYDCNPAMYEILIDGIAFESGDWTSDMTVIQYSLDGLTSGTYVFSIILHDIADNTVSDDVQVTVEEPTVTETTTIPTGTTETVTPTTTTGTESTTPTGGVVSGLDMTTLGLIGLGAGVAIAIVLIIIKRK